MTKMQTLSRYCFTCMALLADSDGDQLCMVQQKNGKQCEHVRFVKCTFDIIVGMMYTNLHWGKACMALESCLPKKSGRTIVLAYR